MPPNVVLALTPQPRGTSSAKVSLGYTPNSEVMSAFYYILSQFLTPPFEKNCKGASVPGGGCASSHFLAGVKIWGRQHPLGAEICSSEKCALGGYTISHRDLQGYWTKLYRTCFA